MKSKWLQHWTIRAIKGFGGGLIEYGGYGVYRFMQVSVVHRVKGKENMEPVSAMFFMN